MIWFLTAVYFLVFSAVIWVGFWLYAKALMYLGCRGFVAKNIIGLIVYILFACFLVAPLFIALSFDSWREAQNSNLYYMVYLGVCFVFSIIPGGVHFKNSYLNDLKNLGYFAKR